VAVRAIHTSPQSLRPCDEHESDTKFWRWRSCGVLSDLTATAVRRRMIKIGVIMMIDEGTWIQIVLMRGSD
jgi:hypothetical protein